jgi:hypothetical protein
MKIFSDKLENKLFFIDDPIEDDDRENMEKIIIFLGGVK